MKQFIGERSGRSLYNIFLNWDQDTLDERVNN
jgi:hypothetical protein